MKDEIVGKALPTDSEIKLRYTLKNSDGSILASNVTVELDNVVVQEGDAWNKANVLPDDTAIILELDPADNPLPKDGLEALMSRIKVNERVEFTSYVGVGRKGSSKPNVLTFEHTPKLLIISQADGVHVSVIYLHAGTNTCATVGGGNIYQGGYCSFTVEGNTVSWYVLGGYWSGSGSGTGGDAYTTAEYQLNESGVTYEVIAITQGWVSE